MENINVLQLDIKDRAFELKSPLNKLCLQEDKFVCSAKIAIYDYTKACRKIGIHDRV